MRTTWTFHSAGKLLFGRGAVRQLGEIAGRMGTRRLFLVTDPALVKAGLLDTVQAPLAEAGVTVGVFAGGEPEPSLRSASSSSRRAGGRVRW
jgi:alcohol dehydrogenase class IV